MELMMFEEQPQTLRDNIKTLAEKAISQDAPASWFEPLYVSAEGDTAQVPWAKNQAHPYLQEWLATYLPKTAGKSALVIGCGLGDDAELLASIGYEVTAFDIAPTAISWCRQRFPNSSVNYLVADLFALDRGWTKQFDFVFECRTIQALPLNVRNEAVKAIAETVAGTLLVVTRHRENDTVPEGPPWALSNQELAQFIELGLAEVRCDSFMEETVAKKVEQCRIEYQR